MRKCAAVDAQKRRKLLARKRDGHRRRTAFLGLHGKICQNALAQSAPGKDRKAVLLSDIFMREQRQKTRRNGKTRGFVKRALLKKKPGRKKENARRRGGDGMIRRRARACADKLRAEKLARCQHTKQRTIPLGGDVQKLHPSARDDAKLIHTLAGCENSTAARKLTRDGAGQEALFDRLV